MTFFCNIILRKSKTTPHPWSKTKKPTMMHKCIIYVIYFTFIFLYHL